MLVVHHLDVQNLLCIEFPVLLLLFPTFSVTRLGDLLDFGPLFKAFGKH